MNKMKGKVIALLAIILVAGAPYVLAPAMTFLPYRTSAAPVLYSQDTVTGIYESASQAVVEIRVTRAGEGATSRGRSGQGSGFLIDNQGHFLTNNHVVRGASRVRVVLNDGKAIEATVAGTDSFNDLAVIKVDPALIAGVVPLTLGNSDAVKPGQMAIAMGNPYGFADTITVGVISGLNRRLSGSGGGTSGMLQTDAAINPGNSGGPLLDADGLVIGINTAIDNTTTGRGIGFAIPSNVAARAVPSLIAGKQLTRPWLGVTGAAITEENVKDLGVTVERGVYVVSTVPGGPAEKAGIKGNEAGSAPSLGDVITSVDGKPVESVQELSAYLNTKTVGDKVVLSVIRNGRATEIQVTLEAWPENVPARETPELPSPHP